MLTVVVILLALGVTVGILLSEWMGGGTGVPSSQSSAGILRASSGMPA